MATKREEGKGIAFSYFKTKKSGKALVAPLIKRTVFSEKRTRFETVLDFIYKKNQKPVFTPISE